MRLSDSIEESKNILHEIRKKGESIGFVPTMGALHEGHLQLVSRATKECDYVAASIFVNPIQFNNKEDLEKYPRTHENDVKLLEENKCDFVFNPSVEEMYPEEEKTNYNFGPLEKVMEGKHRPGHFNGVAIVVKKLFNIIEPDKAFFGQKDYQQLLIIQKLVEMEKLPTEIVPCPTVRELDGLAMSSRNKRLSKTERILAPVLYQTLSKAAEMIPDHSPQEIEQWASEQIENYKKFDLEYLQVADAGNLQPLKDFNNKQNVVICLAAHLGNVRLIDNIIINS